MNLLTVLILVSSAISTTSEIFNATEEKTELTEAAYKNCESVVEDILARVSKHVRPSLHLTKLPITVEWGLEGIQQVEEQQGKITIFHAILLRWKDPRYAWSLKECPVPLHLLQSIQDMWYPLIYINNGYDSRTDFNLYKSFPAYLWYEGEVSFFIYYAETLRCSYHMDMYPWDEHTCNVKFGLGVEANITVTDQTGQPGWGDNAFNDTTWELLNTRIYMETEDFVAAEFVIKRKPSYAFLTMLMPLITLCPLPIVPFILPHNSGEKMAVTLSVMLTYFVLSLNFFAVMPASDVIPTLGKLFLYLLTTTSYATIMAALVLRKSQSEKTRRKKGEDGVERCSYVTAERLNSFGLVTTILFNGVAPLTILMYLVL